LEYLDKNAPVNRADFMRLSALAWREIKTLKRKSWQQCVSHLQYDLHGRKEKAFNVLKRAKQRGERLRYNPIKDDTWIITANSYGQARRKMK
jgi:hypothetical protein